MGSRCAGLAAFSASTQAELFSQVSWPPLSSPADQTLQHRPEQLSMAAPALRPPPGNDRVSASAMPEAYGITPFACRSDIS
jgi:hypothetical protein